MIERSMRSILRLMAILAIAGTFGGTFAASPAQAATAPTASDTSTQAVIVPVPAGSTNGSVAAQAGSGFIKICKTLEAGSPDLGGLFTFNTTNTAGAVLSTVRIDAPATPGQLSCTRFAVPAGVRLTVTEATDVNYIVAPNGITFQADPAGNATTNVFTQQAFVTVVANQTTEVTFRNRLANSSLKICKLLAAGTVAPNRLFRFTVRGNVVYPDVIVRAGTCSQTRVRAGQITVQEVVPADFQVVDISSPTGPGTFNVATATATVNTTVGQTSVVNFTNRGFGFIQVCKVTTGALTSGSFTFTSASAGFGGTQTINVAAGATQPVCGPLTRLPAGRHSITEQASGNTILIGVRTEPVAGRNLTLNGRTASFTLPVGTASQQTLVIFNNALRGFIQICKETTGGLTGTFNFTGTFPGGLGFPAGVINESITVQAGATQPVCGPLRAINAGAISVTEAAAPGTVLTNIREFGPGQLTGRSNRTGFFFIPTTDAAGETLLIFRNAVAP